MERCGRYAELISARLDGMLSRPEEQELQAHLAACAHCRARNDQLAAIHAACAQLEELAAPEGFARDVMAQIRTQGRKQRPAIPLFRRPQVRALAGLAACAALCLGLYQANLPALSSVQSRTADASAAPVEEAGAPEPYQLPSPAPEDTSDLSQQSLDLSQPVALGGQQSFPVTDSAGAELPSARIVGSSQSLTALLALFPDDDLSAVPQAYSPDFFQSGQLLAVVAEADGTPSDCPLWVSALTRSGVTIRSHSLSSGGNRSVWLILVEIPADFSDGEALPVTCEAG